MNSSSILKRSLKTATGLAFATALYQFAVNGAQAPDVYQPVWVGVISFAALLMFFHIWPQGNNYHERD